MSGLGDPEVADADIPGDPALGSSGAERDHLTPTLPASRADRLTAPPHVIARRNPSRLTLGDCWRDFLRRPTPPVLAAALLAALTVRMALGHWDWRDAAVVVGVLAVTPFAEWVIHVYLLHARPIRVLGRCHDLIAAREHREHHAHPAELHGVLVPTYALLIFLPLIAAIAWGLSFPIHLVLGGARVAHAMTGVVVSFAFLAAYEWCHFLIHTPYRPRGRYYRMIWRGHRLHHYKNEHFWFGVTSTLGDQVLGTAPDQAAVPKSATARTLGAEPTA